MGGKRSNGKSQILTREEKRRQENTSQKVVGSNPGAGKAFFLMKDLLKKYNHPIMEFVNRRSVSFIMYRLSHGYVQVADEP